MVLDIFTDQSWFTFHNFSFQYICPSILSSMYISAIKIENKVDYQDYPAKSINRIVIDLLYPLAKIHKKMMNFSKVENIA